MLDVLQYIMESDAEIRAHYDAKTGTIELEENGKSFDLISLAALVCLFTAKKHAKKGADVIAVIHDVMDRLWKGCFASEHVEHIVVDMKRLRREDQ